MFSYRLPVKGHGSPLALLDHRVIVGFHGCDQATADRVLVTGEPMKPSSNHWDWLGEGIYFWEQNPERAWAFAEEQHARGKVKRPSVIGAFIHLGRCFDLTRSAATAALGGAHAALLREFAAVGAPVPVNRPGRGRGDDLLLRDLDCAVLNFHLRDIDAAHGHGAAYYQTVRGVFVEGVPAFPGASIFTKTHTQSRSATPRLSSATSAPRGILPQDPDMDQPTNPYADPQITADAEAARARWERLTPEQRTAFLIEIGILTPDLQLHPRYGGPTPPGVPVDAEAK